MPVAKLIRIVSDEYPSMPVRLVDTGVRDIVRIDANGDPVRIVTQGVSDPINVIGGLLSYNFDTGGLDSYTIIDASVPTIRIVPRKDWNNQWGWFAVSMQGFAGKTPHFLIANADRFNTPTASENLAVWSTSLDTDVWTKFATQTIGVTDTEFYHNTPFPSGTIYVAYLPLYPFSRIVRLIDDWASDARVTDTPSSTNFIIGNATARANGDGRIATALPFYAFLLTNPSGFAKNNMILAARNHPSENQGNYQIEGALNWLLAGSPEAEFLLDWFNVYVYPCVNPQGAWGGWFRSQPQDATKDHNRYWDVNDLECIAAFRAAMAADTGSAIQVGIDYHGAMSALDGYLSSDNHAAGLYAIWLARMQALDAGFGFSDQVIANSLRTHWTSIFAAPLGLSCEYGALDTKGVADWKTQGQYSLRAVTTMHAEGRFTNNPGVGSRDFNGTTDRIDWSNVTDLAGSPITIAMWVYLDNVTAVAKYFFHMAVAGDATGMQLSMLNILNGNFNFTRKGTTNCNRWAAAGTLSTGVWTHIIATNDGTITDYTHTKLYKNGIEVTYASGNNGTGTEVALVGKWTLGGRPLDDLRNLDGRIAQVGVWNRVLTPTEIANLAAAHAPDLAAPSGLQFYFKGNTSSLIAVPGGTGTADGTTQLTGVGNGPAIVYA